MLARKAGAGYRLLANKYYFDAFNERVLAPLARRTGQGLWQVGDTLLIDGAVVNGSARAIDWMSGVVRRVQTGYLYHYAFAMFVGLAAMLGWLLLVVARGQG
jgi:NADH-quinone oxidoreductase subunit L